MPWFKVIIILVPFFIQFCPIIRTRLKKFNLCRQEIIYNPNPLILVHSCQIPLDLVSLNCAITISITISAHTSFIRVFIHILSTNISKYRICIIVTVIGSRCIIGQRRSSTFPILRRCVITTRKSKVIIFSPHDIFFWYRFNTKRQRHISRIKRLDRLLGNYIFSLGVWTSSILTCAKRVCTIKHPVLIFVHILRPILMLVIVFINKACHVNGITAILIEKATAGL